VSGDHTHEHEESTMRRRQGRPGLVGTMARTAVITGTASAVSGSVAQRQHARAQAAAQQPHAPSDGSTTNVAGSEQPPPPPAAPPAPEPPPTTDSTIAELERLVALKQQGVLTDDEFATLKARLLAP
jgi:hypothetical protein